MSRMIEAAAAAFQFLSRFPVKREVPFTPEVLQASVRFYPLVGAVIGLAVWSAGLVANLLLPSSPGAVMTLVLWVALTGGLHLDGWMDCADALLSHRSRENMLDIMKDSRVGAMGVIACVLLLMLKVSLLMSVFSLAYTAVLPWWKPESILLIHAPIWSRWFMVNAMCRWPDARGGQGLAGMFKGLEARQAGQTAISAALLTVIIILVPWITGAGSAYLVHGLIAAIMAPVTAWAVGTAAARRMSRRLGGLTGDTYGALNELIETAVLILIVLLQYHT